MTEYFSKEKNQQVRAGYRIFTKSTNLKKPLKISDKVVNKILNKYNFNIDLEKYDWLQHDYVTEDKGAYNLAVDFLKSS
jgi:translation elongation factor EF-Ts